MFSAFNPPPSLSPEVLGEETYRGQRKNRALSQAFFELLNWYSVAVSLSHSLSVMTMAEAESLVGRGNF